MLAGWKVVNRVAVMAEALVLMSVSIMEWK
jgi:hypothetical protein